MTSTRTSPSGPKIELAGDGAFAAAYRPASILALDEGTTDVVADAVPLPADAPGPRVALVTLVLALVNSAGFDGAPIVVPVGLERNGGELFNMGNARCAPTGPGLAGAGAPFFWTVTNSLEVQPGDVFRLFARSIDGAGGVGSAASVVPSPAAQDAGTKLTFLFL